MNMGQKYPVFYSIKYPLFSKLLFLCFFTDQSITSITIFAFHNLKLFRHFFYDQNIIDVFHIQNEVDKVSMAFKYTRPVICIYDKKIIRHIKDKDVFLRSSNVGKQYVCIYLYSDNNCV